MRAGLRRALAATLGLILAVSIAAAGAVEVAKPRSPSGTSVLTRNGQVADVGSSTQFQEGDIVRVPSDGRLTVEFADGASLTLIGPAALRFGQMDQNGRRVVLGSGVISEAVVRGVALEIQAPDPYDTSFVLQNSRGFARVNPGDSVVFQKYEGNFAKVWRGGKYSELGEVAWSLNVRDGTVASGLKRSPASAGSAAGRNDPLKEEQLENDMVRVHLGLKTITFRPASCFKRQRTAEGGFLLTYQCEDGFGSVIIGRDTTLFVANGQSVEFDANGDVIRFDGISHIYHPLTDPVFYDEPIENAADASPSYSKRH